MQVSLKHFIIISENWWQAEIARHDFRTETEFNEAQKVDLEGL